MAPNNAKRKHRESIKRATAGSHGSLAWPLIACYGPHPHVWQVSGYGSVFVVRRAPDGKEALTIGTLSLSNGGVTWLACKLNADEGVHREFEPQLRQLSQMPASVPMLPQDVADYLYGACALSYADLAESRWPAPVHEALSLVPRPPGTPVMWRNRLAAPGGLTPDALLHQLETSHHTNEPEGKDPVVLTKVWAVLGTGSGPKVVDLLLGRHDPPLFVDVGDRDGARVLEWHRPFKGGPPVPRGQKVGLLFGDSSPENQVTLRILAAGGQQSMGQIAVAGDAVEIECLTLSRASIVVGALAAAAGSSLQIESVAWKDPLSEVRGP